MQGYEEVSPSKISIKFFFRICFCLFLHCLHDLCMLIFQDLDEDVGYDDYYTGDEDELDEYEDEEEEEEEEERKPPKEELEYLELRQKLKDSIRKNMGKGSANAQSSQDRRRKLPYNEYVVAVFHLFKLLLHH